MTEPEHIADQHRKALEGEAWHGPALLEVLADVTAKRAAARPIPKVHTIWEIVLHIEAWDRVVLGRLGGTPIELTDEQDWPPVRDQSSEAWKRAVESMKATHGELNRAIAAMAEARLDESTVPGKPYKLFHMIHGVVHHELYHAGQIALLKKA